MKASDWIDRLKRERKWESDYRVAKELGIGRSAVSRYRSEPESTMDDEVAMRVAVALEVEPEIILLDQVTERARPGPAKAVFAGLLERIGGKARGSSGAAGDGRGRVDITSATSHQSRPHPLQQLARALFPTASPMVAA